MKPATSSPPLWRHSQFQSSNVTQHKHSLTVRANAPLDAPWIRIVLIFGFVIVFSLLAAVVGCGVASCYRTRRITKRNKQEPPLGSSDNSSFRSPIRSPAESSDEYDIEMSGQLDTIVANNTFKGRELNTYKKEVRRKAEKQARGYARTSEGIVLPVNIRQLKGKMRGLSRSLIRSIVRSDPLPEATPDAAMIDRLLEAPKEKTADSPDSVDADLPHGSHRDDLDDRAAAAVSINGRSRLSVSEFDEGHPGQHGSAVQRSPPLHHV